MFEFSFSVKIDSYFTHLQIFKVMKKQKEVAKSGKNSVLESQISESQSVTTEKTEKNTIFKSDEISKAVAGVRVVFEGMKKAWTVSAILDAIFVAILSDTVLMSIVQQVLEYGKLGEDLNTDDKKSIDRAKGCYLTVVRACASYRDENGDICEPYKIGEEIYKFRPVATDGKLLNLFVAQVIVNIWHKSTQTKVDSTKFYDKTKNGYELTAKSAKHCKEVEANSETIKKDAREAKALESAKERVQNAGYEIVEKCTFEEAFNRLAAQDPTQFRRLCLKHLAKYDKSVNSDGKKEA